MPLGIKRMTSLSYAPLAEGRDALTLTGYDGAELDTAQYKFGTASLYLTTLSDRVVVDVTDVWNSSEFTVEFFARLESKDTYQPFFIAWEGGEGTTFRFQLAFESNNDYGFLVYYPPSGVLDAKTGGLTYTNTNTGQWYHCAFVKQNDGTTALYVDGTRRDTGSGGTFTADTLVFGRNGYTVNGHMDEIRISKVARYTGASYTVPTSAFTNDADTILLTHMDGSDGSTTFLDDNG